MCINNNSDGRCFTLSHSFAVCAWNAVATSFERAGKTNLCKRRSCALPLECADHEQECAIRQHLGVIWFAETFAVTTKCFWIFVFTSSILQKCTGIVYNAIGKANVGHPILSPYMRGAWENVLPPTAEFQGELEFAHSRWNHRKHYAGEVAWRHDAWNQMWGLKKYDFHKIPPKVGPPSQRDGDLLSRNSTVPGASNLPQMMRFKHSSGPSSDITVP